jgi:catechol 2,3-dioxygenase-like lactoylglutathione lyase family enzyme
MSDVPKLYRVLIQVSNIAQASAFYARLLNMEGHAVAPSRHYFACGAVILGLVDPTQEGGEAARPNPEHLYFAVSDLEAVQRRARELGCLSAATVHDARAGDILTRPWGERSFYADDPFGNLLCFVDEQTLFTGA